MMVLLNDAESSDVEKIGCLRIARVFLKKGMHSYGFTSVSPQRQSDFRIACIENR